MGLLAAAFGATVSFVMVIRHIAAYTEATTQFTPVDCRFRLPDGYTVECGELIVPEDYDAPNGRHIRLHVAIVHGRGVASQPDPLIILYGGPGAYALDRLDRIVDRFSEVLTERDIIVLDQRGVGYSQPSLNCPEIDDLDADAVDMQLSTEQAFARRLAAYRNCRDRLQRTGVDLEAYSVASLSADAAGLRQALGYDMWNLYGVSYGSRQALLIMRDHPTGLRSVILDSVYPLDIDLAAEAATMNAYALDMLFSANEAQHPDFEQEFYRLVSELDSSPMRMPAIIPQRFILPYQSFSGDDLIRLMIHIVSSWPQALPHMPGFVSDISHGNYAELIQLARPSVGDQLFSEGLNLSVICQETQLPSNLKGFGNHSTRDPRLIAFTRVDVVRRMALCATWLAEDPAPPVQEAVFSDIPTLVLRGEQDAVIPASWEVRALEGLSSLTRLTFPGIGHGVVNSSACASDAVAEFLRTPTMTRYEGCLD